MQCGGDSCLTHLSIVALQVEDVLKRGEGVDVDDISVDSCKHVAAVAKSTLKVRREKAKTTVKELKSEHTINTHTRIYPTSLQPRTVNSLKVRMSSISRFISLSLSEKPTRMKRPVGCRAKLYASSWNSLYSSNTLVTVMKRACP